VVKIKEITLHLTKKLPIEGIPFSNKEAGFSITYGVGDEELNDSELIKMWADVKRQVKIGLDEDEAEWQMKDGKKV